MALLSLILAKKNGTTAIISQIFSLWNDDLLSACFSRKGEEGKAFEPERGYGQGRGVREMTPFAA